MKIIDIESFACDVLQYVFDLERQGDWMGDIVSSIESNDGDIDPMALAEELLSNIGSVSSVAEDIQQIMESYRE